MLRHRNMAILLVLATLLSLGNGNSVQQASPAQVEPIDAHAVMTRILMRCKPGQNMISMDTSKSRQNQIHMDTWAVA